jgi:tRNA uridine 5-carbamoylmethylation protein Kti12
MASEQIMPNERHTEGSCDNDDVLNNPRISVILLAGLPASGKSTLVRKLMERFDEDDRATSNDPHTVERANDDDAIYKFKFIHIEYDNLEDGLLSSVDIERIGRDGNGNEIGNRRRDAWNQARQHAVEQMEQEIQKIIAMGESSAPTSNTSTIATEETVILMDDNFHLRGMRKQIHRLLLNYRPIRFGILYLETSLDICLERNCKRSGRRQVPSDIIVKMSTSFEPPRVAWEVCSTKTVANYDSSEDDCVKFEEIVKFIQDCPNIVELPSDDDVIDVELQAADRTKTRESQIHSLDKLLRSYVGRVAKFDKTFAKKANSARKTVMEEFKAGRIDNECIADAFLEHVVPADSPSITEADSDAHSTIRSQLREVLDLS